MVDDRISAEVERIGRTVQSYLELQERISAESRAYSALSNVLKARHDTVKNAIGNIR